MTPPVLDDILDSLFTAVVRLDPALRVVYLNPAAADLFETSPRHASNRPLQDILPLDDDLPGLLSRASSRGEPLLVPELTLLCGQPPGRRRFVSCEILPLEGDAGLQLELQALDRRQLLAAESGLQQNSRAQRLLFQALAHEVKNPLSGLRGAAQLLASEEPGAGQREYLDVMLREIDRLRDLVDALPGPARALRPKPVNIHAVLEHVRILREPALPENISWKRDYDPSLPELQADPDQLTQVFLNLSGNAIEALQSSRARPHCLSVRSRIERNAMLHGRRHRVALRVDVTDDGPGVPDPLRETLFLPLITGRAEGTGLGLPIAQDIVQRHGGNIEWRSEPGETVFTVILPLHGPPAESFPESRSRAEIPG